MKVESAIIQTLCGIYTGLGLIVLCGAVFPVLKGAPELAFLYPHHLYKLAIAALIAVGAGFAYLDRRALMQRLKRNPALVALLVWMGLSLFWTQAPNNRLSVIAGFVSATLYGFHLAKVMPRQQHLLIAAATLTLILFVSLALTYQLGLNGFATPHYQEMGGLFSNKNIMIRLACLSIPLAVLLLFWRSEPVGSKYATIGETVWLVGLVAMGLWVGTQFDAFTSKVAFLGGAAVWILVLVAQRSWKVFVCVAILCILGIATVLYFLDDLLTAMRETSGLKNRLFHWSQMVGQDTVFSWTGAGLGGFWDRIAGSWQQLSLKVPLRHGHNGFIDIWLDLGYVGLGLLLAAIVIPLYRLQRIPLYLWNKTVQCVLTSATMLFVYNLSESSILPTNSANTLMWGVFVAFIILIPDINNHPKVLKNRKYDANGHITPD